MSHTPGPWTISKQFGTVSGEHENVCRLCHDIGATDEREKGMANARLIAAAPDLLAAVLSAADMLRRVASKWQLGRLTTEFAQVQNTLEAAIAKAESK